MLMMKVDGSGIDSAYDESWNGAYVKVEWN